jgi:putative NADH-flavin reductase
MPPGRIILIAWIIYALAFTLALARRAPCSKKSGGGPHALGDRLRILVIGATGGTGRELVRQGLAQGHQVTAFVRNPEKLRIKHSNLRVLQGNVLDYDTVEPAVQGQSAVLSALGHKRFLGPSTVLSEGTRNILRAMQNSQVPRFICETSLGVGNTVGRLGLPATLLFVPLILPFYLWDRIRQEKLIEESSLDWVIVRPATLTNGAARGNYRHGPKVGSYIPPNYVSRADVAGFMLKQLNDDTYLGSAPGICY